MIGHGTLTRLRRVGAVVVFIALASTGGDPATAQSSSPDPGCYDPIDRALRSCPDLAFASTPSWSFEAPMLRILTTVANGGDIASGPTSVRAAAEGWPIAFGSVPPLDPGSSVPVTVGVPVSDDERGQTVFFDLQLDPDNTVPELDEENNFTTIEVTIPPPATETSSSTAVTTAPAHGASQGPASGESGATSSRPVAWVIVGLLAFGLLALGTWLRLARRERLHRKRHAPRRSREPPARGPRPVLDGFSSEQGEPLDRDSTLAAGGKYRYWLAIGRSMTDHADSFALDGIHASTELTVDVRPLGRGPAMIVESRPSTVALLGSGDAVAVGRPDSVPVGVDPFLGEQTTFFEVFTPNEPGTYRLRSSLYHDGTLVQSRLVTAQVTAEPRHSPNAVRSDLDYSLSTSLDPAQLWTLPSHRMIIMLNRSDEDTHDLLFTSEHVRTRVSLDALALQKLVQVARGGLRLAAWGDDGPWALGKRYRYVQPTLDQLRVDVARMAQRGMALYAKLAEGLDGGHATLERLEEDLRHPGTIQFALGRSARRLLPASLVYDYRGLETESPAESYSICETFERSMGEGQLEDAACFTSGCPARGERLVVCPSGFWGFRHEVGFPVSTGERDATSQIRTGDVPGITVGVSTDPNLVERPGHERVLRELWRDGAWTYADSRQETLRVLRDADAGVVYLYCHGGVTQIGEPFFQVGETTEPGITATVLLSSNIRWETTRPLVFINGCHTTDVEPENAFELVSPLVALAAAAGVIGTEITVFEPLACAFAEAFLRRFVGGAGVGEAVRGARLELLAEANPLGLAYIPFALGTLHLSGGDGGSDLRRGTLSR